MGNGGSPGQAAPNWYPDPTEHHELRYWSGTEWTPHVADAGKESLDPLAGPPGQSGASVNSGWLRFLAVAVVLAVTLLGVQVFSAVAQGGRPTPLAIAELLVPFAVAAAIVWGKHRSLGIGFLVVLGLLLVSVPSVWGWAQYGASSAFASGEAAFAQKSWEKAIGEFEKVADSYPRCDRADEARVRVNDARTEQAKSLSVVDEVQAAELLDVVKTTGTAEQKEAAATVATAMYERAGDRHVESGEVAEAADDYEQAQAESGGSPSSTLSGKIAGVRERQAAIAMSREDPDQAADYLDQAADLSTDNSVADALRKRAAHYRTLEPPSRTLNNLRASYDVLSQARLCVRVLKDWPKSPNAAVAAAVMRSKLRSNIKSLQGDAKYYRGKVREVRRKGRASYYHRFSTSASKYRKAGTLLRRYTRTRRLGSALTHMATATKYGSRSVGIFINVSRSLRNLSRCDKELRTAARLAK